MTAQLVERIGNHNLLERGVLTEPLPILRGSAEERAVNVASFIGCEMQEMERLPFDLSALESDGVFINDTACQFGCRRALSPL